MGRWCNGGGNEGTGEESGGAARTRGCGEGETG